MSDHIGGAFEQGDPLTTMVDVWGYLLVKYQVKSVIDVGCGFGHTLKWFAEYGCQITGIEGWHEAVERSQVPGMVIEHDFTKGVPSISHSVNLAWSAEFLEHVDEECLPNVMPVFKMAKYSCITHGEPGQPGYHHVNCRPSEYWRDKFAEYGMIWDERETALLRRTDRWQAMYGRRTLMFFVRQ